MLHDICVLKSGIVLEDTYTQERKREMTRILILIFLYNFSPLSFTFEISYEQSWIHTDLHI